MRGVKVCMDCEREERMKVEKVKVVSLERERERYAERVRREARSKLVAERKIHRSTRETQRPRAGASNANPQRSTGAPGSARDHGSTIEAGRQPSSQLPPNSTRAATTTSPRATSKRGAGADLHIL